jgi:hypothetical protein
MPRKSTDADYVPKSSKYRPSKEKPPPVTTVKGFNKLDVPPKESSPKNVHPEVTSDPTTLFELFFDEEIIQGLVERTNSNAEQWYLQHREQDHRPWHPVSLNEMYAYLGKISSGLLRIY